jgi:prephenate dehydratase
MRLGKGARRGSQNRPQTPDKGDSTMRVAYQGEPGAYSEAATIRFFDAGVEPVPCATFDEVFRRVQAGECDRGTVPIENSLAGSIHRNYDLLLRHDLSIVGEVILRVSHNLIANPGVDLEALERVYSHPQALDQCEQTLNALFPHVQRIPTYDTAGSVKLLRESNDRHAAALASRRAAELHGMSILRENLEDDPQNFTRFLVLSREAIAPSRPAKTSVVFAAKNVPGALFKSLSVFALRDIDLTKIESRPLQGKPWEYFFYVDFAGTLDEARCINAINNLKEIATFLRVLGSYPRDQVY